jgi:hypothetical protein
MITDPVGWCLGDFRGDGGRLSGAGSAVAGAQNREQRHPDGKSGTDGERDWFPPHSRP